MTVKLQETIKICDQIFSNCDIDYEELGKQVIDETFFEKYENTRIVNSFLFNFSKLQDKIGTKLFKQVLYELREIDNTSVAMIDVLNILEKMEIVTKTEWDGLREIRNQRVENIQIVLKSYGTLKKIYEKLKNATQTI